MDHNKPQLHKVKIVDFSTSDIKDTIYYIPLSIKTFAQVKNHQSIVLNISNEDITITYNKPFNLFGLDGAVNSIKTWDRSNIQVIEDLILTIYLRANKFELYKINFYILNNIYEK
jgi:hypothetical protein